MKVPEPLFVVINPVVKILLSSPVHGLLSDSVMVVYFKGRKSGREFSTPVRYMRDTGADGERIRAFSNKDTQWWRNLRDGAQIQLRAAGELADYQTRVIENDPATIREHLIDYLAAYPEDAVYHDVSMDADGKPDPSDLDEAAQHAVVIEARSATTLH